MSFNVYRPKTRRRWSNSTNALNVKERMNYEVLIDLFRKVCKTYGIQYQHIAKNSGLKREYVYSVLNKRQYATLDDFIDMCEVLKVMVQTRIGIRARQLIIPL